MWVHCHLHAPTYSNPHGVKATQIRIELGVIGPHKRCRFFGEVNQPLSLRAIETCFLSNAARILVTLPITLSCSPLNSSRLLSGCDSFIFRYVSLVFKNGVKGPHRSLMWPSSRQLTTPGLCRTLCLYWYLSLNRVASINEDESRTLFAARHESRSYVSITQGTGLFGIPHSWVLAFSPVPVYFGTWRKWAT